MKLNNKQRRSILDSVEDLFQDFKARLLGRYFKDKHTIWFEVARHSNPLETIEGLFRYGIAMLYGPGADIDEDKIEKLAGITGNYIDAEKLKLVNRVSQRIDQADTPDELRSLLEEDFDKTTSYIETLTNTETRNVQSYAEQDGIIQVAASIGIEDPTVAKLGPLDGKTCKNCLYLWHDDQNPRKPKLYKMSELQGGYSDHKNPIPTLLATHPNCFTDRRTLVLTDKGWIQIGKIAVGDKVLSHTGKFQRVYETVKFPYSEKKAYKITYDYNGTEMSVKVTPDHEFLSNGQWVQAHQLKTGDSLTRLIIPCAVCHNEVKKPYNSSISTAASTCSKKCQSELSVRIVTDYHKNLTDEEKIIRVSNCSNGTLNAYKEGKIVSKLADKNYWTPERRKITSDSIKSRMSIMLNASASTRISKHQKYAFGWLKTFFSSEKIEMEYSVDRYAIDIAFPDHKIAIEIDGKYHEVDRLEKDRLRDKRLADLGWTTLRFGKSTGICITKKNVCGGVARVLANHNGEYGFKPCKILNIKEINSGYKVNAYCLRVEEDASFISAGVVSHNCRHIMTMISPGFGFDESGRVKWMGLGYDAYEQQKLNKTEPIVWNHLEDCSCEHHLAKAFRPSRQQDRYGGKTLEERLAIDDSIKRQTGVVSQMYGQGNEEFVSDFIRSVVKPRPSGRG